MPVFYPDNVQTNSPSINPIVLGSSNHISGVGFFDGISTGNTKRNDIGSSFRAPGYLAVVYDSTSVADSEMYVYASTNITDGAWTTTSNWKSFEGAANTNLATNNLTQALENRTYDIPNGQTLTFQGAGNEEFQITSNSNNNVNEIFLKAGQLRLSNATGDGGKMAFLDGDESAAVTIASPVTLSGDYQLTLPTNAAGDDRLIQSNSTGTLSYAELSFASNTLVIGAQSVDISTAGTNTNLATDNLTQDSESRTYDTNGNSLAFTNGGTGIFQIEGSAEFAAVINGKVLRFNEDANTDYVGLTAPTSVGASYTLTLPNAVAGGDRLIQSDSSGNLSYATVSFDSATDELVIGAQSTDISAVNTNLATTNLTQSQSSRTYTFTNNDFLDFETSGTGKLRIQDSSGEMAVTVEGSESSYIGVFGGSANVFGFSPNTSQGGNIILKAPPGYTEGGIWYNESNQIKFATPTFDSPTSQLVIGTNSTNIGGVNTNLANSDLVQNEAERKYNIGTLSLAFGNAADSIDLLTIKPTAVEIGKGIPLHLLDDANSDYVGLDVPSSVTSYTLTLPNAVASGNRLIQTDTSGNLSYAELSISTDTLVIGAQSVVLPSGGSGNNLSTANLTQTDATRTYDIDSGRLSFTEGPDAVLEIQTTGSDTFASPYTTKFRGFQTFEPQTAGAGLSLDLDSDYLTAGRFWGEVMELAPEQATFSVGEVVTFDGSNAITTALNTNQARSSGLMMMAVTGSTTKKYMTRGYICLSKSIINGIGSDNNDAGAPLYVHSTAGDMTITTPSGGSYMRMVGHLILVNHGTGVVVVYFNPEGSVFKTI